MIYVLRLVHILAGAFWFGAVIFTARLLIPALRAAGPAAGPVMAQLEKHKITPIMMSAAFLTLGSGIWLMFIVSGGQVGVWMRTGMGRTLGFGAAMAILAMIVGMVVNPPAVKRLGEIAAGAAKRGGPPTPEEAAEIGRLQNRMGTGTVIVALLMTLAVAAMAVARYL